MHYWVSGLAISFIGLRSLGSRQVRIAGRSAGSRARDFDPCGFNILHLAAHHHRFCGPHSSNIASLLHSLQQCHLRVHRLSVQDAITLYASCSVVTHDLRYRRAYLGLRTAGSAEGCCMRRLNLRCIAFAYTCLDIAHSIVDCEQEKPRC